MSAPVDAYTGDDARWMELALAHGARHIGQAMPNTSVGAVIVRQGQVVGVGTTGVGGRPHAETFALEQAGEAARGATLYVTLEPCSHHGKTPPCAEAVIAAGIVRVVIAATDPDVRVSGQGIATLREAGIAVAMADGVCQAAAHEQHRGFFKHRLEGKPYVAMKLATSLDAASADAFGASQWITGEAARTHAHGLRAKYDALLSGIGTVETDQPHFTCRLPGLAQASPIRIIADTNLRLSPHAALLAQPLEAPVWVLCSAEAMAGQEEKVESLRGAGVELLPCRRAGEHLDLTDAIARLADKGVTRLLVEAGPRLSSALLEAKQVERVYWYRAPLLLGRSSRVAVQPAMPALADAAAWRLESEQALGADRLAIYALPNAKTTEH